MSLSKDAMIAFKLMLKTEDCPEGIALQRLSNIVVYWFRLEVSFLFTKFFSFIEK